jgi:anaerobic selenocysteine-containing dehydrogenase
MADLGRRRFLGGAGLLAGALSACRPQRDPYSVRKPAVPLPPGLRRGTETRKRTTCGMCPAACGIEVRMVEGRAVRIVGNPESPVNRGGVCARGQAALEILYHPDRIAGPMHRVGPRGANDWQPLAWDEAISHLAEELGHLRREGTPWGLTVIDGERRGTTHALWSRFLRVFGSPNHIGHGATSWGALVHAMRTLTGVTALPGYDFEDAGSVLLVGSGTLESAPLAMHLDRAIAAGKRPTIFCLAPRIPFGGGLVDEWLPVLPGRSADVLWGIAAVILREQLADEDALSDVPGYPAYESESSGPLRLWRDQLMERYTPAAVETATGIPARQLTELARGLVADRPSVVVPDEGGVDDATAAAAIVVNALLGVLAAPGGMLVADSPSTLSLGDVALDELGRVGEGMARVDGTDGVHAGYDSSRVLDLPARILAGQPYRTQALLLHYSNPVLSKVDGAAWLRALASIPLVVSFSPWLDESARFADLVLPDLTFFERHDLVLPERGSRTLAMRRPVVEPLGNGMQTADVILRLAGALGAPLAQAFAWKNPQEVCQAALVGMGKDDDDIAAALDEHGVWQATDASPGRRVALRALPDLTVTASSPAYDPVAFPFVLVPFRGPGHGEGGARVAPWLAELPMTAGDPWQSFIEMGVEDARRWRISDGDRVVVESPLGAVEVPIRVRAGLAIGVLGVPLESNGTVLGVPDGPMRLLAARTEPGSGQWLAGATRARVRKVT